jgi:hypothetical protein
MISSISNFEVESRENPNGRFKLIYVRNRV